MRQIAPGDEESAFVCARGDAQVQYLREQALAAHSSDMSRTYVLIQDGPGEPRLLGFYAICMGKVTSTDLPENKGKKVAQTGTPAALLAQLATDDRAERGLGARLLLDALKRMLAIADQIGCRGAILHAANPELVSYYKRFGFEPIGSSASARPQMWLSMKDIRATFADVETDSVS